MRKLMDWVFNRVWIVVCLTVIGNALTGCASLQRDPSIISINPRVVNNLRFLYDNVQMRSGVEFAYCVYGRTAGDTIFVQGVDLAHINNATMVSVNYNYADCQSEGLLGTGHSHPPLGEDCVLSETDWNTFRSETFRFNFLTCSRSMLLIINRRDIPTTHVAVGK